jgi:hypothetical protein
MAELLPALGAAVEALLQEAGELAVAVKLERQLRDLAITD